MMADRGIGLLVVASAAMTLLGVTACSGPDPAVDPQPTASLAAPPLPASTAPQPSATPRSSPTPDLTTPATTPAPVPSVAEPTTTNTLPPPPRPSRAAPATAGKLSAASLPVPAGWRTIARAGGSEEGYQGNGTWVHARDPRYAASDVITLGCRPVTRDDYPDPTRALEGSYIKGKTGKKGEPGIGLVLQFATEQQASRFYDLYVAQVRACRGGDAPLQTKVVPSGLGLIDHRSYPDGQWTEVARRHGSRVTLVILSDPRHQITRAESEALLRRIA